MGKRGPKPTPTARLKLSGSWRAKARVKAGEPQPSLVTTVPTPPVFLGDYGMAEWERIVPELVQLRVLTQPDLTSLGLLCKALDDYWQADEAVNRYGILVDGAHGGLTQNPAALERNRAWNRYRQGCAVFGCTPADRTRITGAGGGTAGKTESALGKLLRGA